jgi:hypothetical protein
VTSYSGIDLRTLELIKISLIESILLAIDPNAMTDANTLLEQNPCLVCLTPQQAAAVEISLLQSLLDAITAQNTLQEVFSEEEGLFVAGVPTVVPSGDAAFCIADNGTIFTYYDGSWK